MPETILNTVSAFTIRELTGQERSLRLVARALPYRPFELTGTQRHEITWYPGAPTGTLQMLGAKEEETTIRGKWKDRFIGASIAGFGDDSGGGAFAQLDGEGLDVRTLVSVADDIRRQGQLLEITWLDIARRGILSKFMQRWETAEDVDWEMTFSWIAQGNENELFFPPEVLERDISDVPARMQSELDAFDEGGAVLLAAGIEAAEIAGAIDAGVFQIQSAITAIESNTVQNITNLTSPVASAQKTAGILDFAKNSAINVDSVIQDRAISAVSNVASTFGELLTARKRSRDQSTRIRNIKRQAAEAQSQAEKSASPELLRVFVARQDQDLREVSRVHYGTSDEWRGLLTFNNLRSSKLSAGQLIFVPQDPPRKEC